MTGLRGFAAFLVFLSHAGYLIAFHDPAMYDSYAHYVRNGGSLALSFFFVLSGFVLTWGARTGDTPTRFWRGRFFKIFPNHVLVFVVLIGILIMSPVAVRVPEAVANLFLVQTWLPITSFYLYPVNGTAWSLVPEMLFYANFPWLILLVRKIPVDRLWRVLALVFAGILAIPALVGTVVPETPLNPFVGPHVDPSWHQYWLVYFFPLTRALEFIAGMLVARILLSGRWIRFGLRPALLLLAGVYAVSLYVPDLYKVAAIWPIPAALLIAAAATNDIARRRTLFNRRATVWGGEISYAFFLIHVPMLFIPNAALNGEWAGYLFYEPPAWSLPVTIVYMAASFTASVLVAALLYQVVERPMMRRFAPSRSDPRAGAPAGRRVPRQRSEPGQRAPVASASDD